MNDKMKQLTDKFMAGETSRSEEQQLAEMLKGGEQSAEAMILLSMLEMPKAEPATSDLPDIDNSEEYDRIVNRRKRLAIVRRWAVAACIAAIVFLGGLLLGDDGTTEQPQGKPQQTAKAEQKVAQPVVEKKAEPVLQVVKEQPKAVAVAAKPVRPKQKTQQPIVAEPEETIVPMTTQEVKERLIAESGDVSYADSLEYYVDRVERELESVSDSLYLVRVQKVIAADEKLQKIVNRIIFESMESDSKPQEAVNTFETFE